MKPFEKMKVGMGIGGWMTNYKRVRFLPADRAFEITIGDKEHFDRYITRTDIQNIRGFGMDHIRVPFDQVVIEEYDKPYVYREDMLQLLDRMLGWCVDEGFEVILNLHHAIGCYCDHAEASGLLDSEELMLRFIGLWEMLEDRYHETDIIFEILNEVTTTDSVAWNALATRCIEAIRKKNPTRRIIMGCAGGNNIPFLKDMKVFDDEYIGYTYHFYDPFEFTHQRTTVNPHAYVYNREVPYPGDNSYYKDFAVCHGWNPDHWDRYPVVGREYIEDRLRPAVEWKKAHPDKFLWFGEFGTIHHARLEWRLNWMRDVIRNTVENGIPFASWNYLSTPYDCNKFSLVREDDRKIVCQEMLALIQGRV